VTPTQWICGLATILAAAGMWLVLPRRGLRDRFFGAVLAAVAAGLWLSQVPRLDNWLHEGMFLIFAATTIVSAGATVCLRSPVYCAIWFGVCLLSAAGLFLYQGAQFLASAVVVVYAGAILVTFLFVLMLAQPEGKAPYDRVSWEALLSATVGTILVGILTTAVTSALARPGSADDLPPRASATSPIRHVGGAVQPGAKSTELKTLGEHHVAQLGGELFGRHLLSVQVAGVLLFAALVGAAAMVAMHAKPRNSATPTPTAGRNATP
jgi:NADH-quinone oxidoreductase subunit J